MSGQIQCELKNQLKEFSNYLEFERRYSKHTLKSYHNDILQFADYIETQYEGLKSSFISHLHIRSWMVNLVELKISARSINRKVSALRSMFNFLKREGYVSKNPTLKIVTPKIGKRLPSFVQEENIEKLFDTISLGDFEDCRNRTLIELMYLTGIRRIELIELNDKSIDCSNSTIKVLGKGNKERLIPLSKPLLVKIKTYQELRDQKFESEKMDKNLFLTSKGKKLYPKLVYNIVKSYLSTVTTIKKRSPHVLRHSFATHLMNGGADLNAVKELLGHANLAATQVYTHNSIEKLKEIYKNTHPKGDSSGQ